MKKYTKIALAAAVVVLAGCAASQTPVKQKPTTSMVGLANPASVFCIQQGGQSQIVNTPKGQEGYCQWSNGQRIEEWKYFREHHKDNQDS
jgi:hypothetical protein